VSSVEPRSDRVSEGAAGTGTRPAGTPGTAAAGAAASAGRQRPGRGTTFRATRQGDAVSAALTATDSFTSAQDLHARLRQQGESVGLTTVYRHLQVLVDRGEVDVLRRDDGETLYRRCATDTHHHHLICRQCGRTVEVAGREIEAWTARVAAAEGFTEVAHTIEIYGTCSDCAA
jgi:Fur family transcriptional regulator, ferric uptake regulator